MQGCRGEPQRWRALPYVQSWRYEKKSYHRGPCESPADQT